MSAKRIFAESNMLEQRIIMMIQQRLNDCDIQLFLVSFKISNLKIQVVLFYIECNEYDVNFL